MRQHTIQTPYVIGEVHCYSTEINGELVLFDSGPPTPEALASLKTQIDLSRLKYLFITHCHIDHCGLAAQIAENSDARILIPKAEAVKLRQSSQALDQLTTLLSNYGCDDKTLSFLREKMGREQEPHVVPDHFEIVEESDVPSRLGIGWLGCPGHSQSDLVYLSGEYAITGDILLRNIFQVPILDVDTQTFTGRFRNYDAYCDSIRSLELLRTYQVCPGHRSYIEGVDTTIVWYAKKLLERAALVKDFSAETSPYHIMKAIFGGAIEYPFFVHMKLSEIVFIQDFLEKPWQLKEALEFLGLFENVSVLYHSVTKKTLGNSRLRCCAT